MAKYIVENRVKDPYKKSYGMPMINLLPALVWSIPVHQKLYPDINSWVALGLSILFIAVYVGMCYFPFAVIPPAIASVIMITGLFWVFADYIGNQPVRIIVKIVIALIAAFMEISVVANAMLPWMEAKEINKPIVRKIEE